MRDARFRWVLLAWLALVGPAVAQHTGMRPASMPGGAAATTADVPRAARESLAVAAGAPSIARFLDAAGRARFPDGFSGRVDPTGFLLVSRPGEAPRLSRKNAIDDPARWDPQFGQAIGCNGTVAATAALPDGRIVIGGNFTLCGNVAVNRIAAWNPATGTFAAFGSGSANGVNDRVNALAVAGTDVYVGGAFTQAGGAGANRIARFDTTSQAWSSLGVGAANGVDSVVTAIAVAGPVVYVGGFFAQAGGSVANNVARFGTATQTWSSLGVGAANGVNNPVQEIVVAGSDVYVGGFFSQAGGLAANNIARFDAASQSWSTLGAGAANGVNSRVDAMVVVGTDLYVGGVFNQAGGLSANRVARFTPGTQAWSSLGMGASNGVDAAVLTLAAAGSDVFVGGSFSTAGGAPASRIARFSTTTQGWASLGTGAANGANGDVLALAVVAGDLYAGGDFTQAGGALANRAARFNTGSQSWSSLGAGATNGISGGVNAIAVSGGDLYVGGDFTQAGGARANFVARFNAASQSWSSLGSGAANGVNDVVHALAVVGNNVYVGGSFTEAGGAPANRVARFDVITQTWSALGAGPANGVGGDVLALASAAGDVYVGGLFSQAGGAAASNVARFRTTTSGWASLGAGASNGVNGVVYALAIAGSTLYVGGSYTRAGGAVANNVARFDTGAQSWSLLGAGAGNGVGGTVHDLALTGSDLLVAGSFAQAGGAPANNIARFNTATQAWSTLGAGAANGVDGIAYALSIAGGDVQVGGDFTIAGGATANRVARYATTTQTWSSLGVGAANGVGGSVRAVATTGTDIYLGGFFTDAGPNVSLRIARYDTRRGTTSSIASSVGNSAVANTPITFTGTIAATAFPAVPGTVAFLDDGVVIPGCAAQPLVGGLDTRAATCTTSALRAGLNGVVARYSGDALNFIGTSDPVAVTVLPPTFAFTPATLPNATFGTPGYSSGAISVGTAAGSGIVAPVTLSVLDPGLLPPGLTAAPLANGILITGTPTQAGTFTFTVRATDSSTTSATGGPFSGDRQSTIVVARAAQTITPITRVDSVPLDNGVAFADGDFAVQANASSALPVAIDSTTPGVCQVVAPAFTVQPLQIGTCTLRARQIGNGNYEPAPEVLRTFQVKATPDAFVSSAPNPSVFLFGAAAPDPVVITATVETPGTATPTGTVRFVRAGNTIAGCAAQPLSGTGSSATATCTTTSLARGANALAAQYLGDALNVAATSNAATHQLNVGTATGIATITPSPCVVGQACTVAVAVASPSGTPTGSVQVASSTGGSCTITLAAGGGSCALTATTSGSGTVSATYLGSPPWLASPAATQGHPFVATVDELFANSFEPVARAMELQ